MRRHSLNAIFSDVGEPLFLTPLLEAGEWKEAQECRLYLLNYYSFDMTRVYNVLIGDKLYSQFYFNSNLHISNISYYHY